MAQRLTNDLKRDIKNQILDETFVEKKAVIQARREAMADDVYKASFDETVLAKIKDLPPEWVRVDDNIGITVLNEAGREMYWSFKFSDGRCLPMPATYKWRNQFLDVLKTDDEFAIRALEIDSLEAELRTERETLTSAIEGVLGSVTTLNKLLEVAPDWKQYVPEWYLEEKKSVPAVRIDAVNELIEAFKKAA